MAHLKGMMEITGYARRSEATIISWIREMGFPARKITGGVWESDTELIDKWRMEQLSGASTVNEREKESPRTHGKSTRKANPKPRKKQAKR